MFERESRWWVRAGEEIWSDTIDRLKWSATLESADSQMWSLRLVGMKGLTKKAEHRAFFPLDDDSAADSEESIDARILESLTATCRRRAAPRLEAGEQAILDFLLGEFTKDVSPRGRVIRGRLNLGKNDWNKRVQRIQPRYMQESRYGDSYSLSTAGLLYLAESDDDLRGIVETTLGAFGRLWNHDPGFESFELRHLQIEGCKAPAPLVDKTIQRLELGKGSGERWSVPEDIEELVHLSSFEDFLRYCPTAADVPRAWPSAPIRLPGDPAIPEDDEILGGRPYPQPSVVEPTIRALAPLGHGAFSDVWRGEDGLSRTVAIKFVRASMALEADARTHAQALARVNHPSIVTLYGLEPVRNPATQDVEPAVVMEYLDGKTLTELLLGVVNPIDGTAWCFQLVSAIRAIHGEGLVHGDLHKGNVMITLYGIKIIDILYRDTLGVLGTRDRKAHRLHDIRRAHDLIEEILAVSHGLEVCDRFRDLARSAEELARLETALRKAVAPGLLIGPGIVAVDEGE